MREYLVYWYHLDSHKDPYSQGYVGVTCQNSVRKRCHKAGISGGSKILCNAFKKYGEDAIEQTILHVVNSSEEAYRLENLYRPLQNIGWNIAVGGGLPPDSTGRKDSPEVREQRRQSVIAAKAGKHYPSKFKGMTGRFTDEQRKKIGEYHKGKVISDAHKQASREKLSEAFSPFAKEIYLVHVENPQKVYTFPCIKTAARELDIKYNALRSVAQRVFKTNTSSDPSRSAPGEPLYPLTSI